MIGSSNQPNCKAGKKFLFFAKSDDCRNFTLKPITGKGYVSRDKDSGNLEESKTPLYVNFMQIP